MFVVDASVWVSRFIISDDGHKASYAWLEAAISERLTIVAPILLLAEVAGAIGRRLGNELDARRAVSYLDRMTGFRALPVDRELVRNSVALAARFGLRGSDATYVAAADRFHIPLVTWDREQLERPRGAILAYTPQELLSTT